MADKDSSTDKTTKADRSDGTSDVKVKKSEVKVTRVAFPDEPTDEYYERQDSALQHYKLTGEVGEFLDPLRDQEPDIAPEFGIAPHPELANPAPRKGSISAVASASPVVRPVEEKVKADDASAAVGEAAGGAVTAANPSERV